MTAADAVLELHAVLELRGAALRYPGPPPVDALRPTDLVVQRGEYVTIMGSSGSGKSTLLNVLGLLDRPTAGCVLFDGIDVAGLDDADRTALRGSRLGFVFQSFHLLPYRDATENVMLAQVYNRTPRADRAGAARAVLEQVGLSHRLHALPPTLSGGERQRVAIARALVNRPSLILCDEPTGNLDSEATEIILRLLADLHQQGLTLVVITHDPAVAGRGQRLLTMRDGVLRASNTLSAYAGTSRWSG